VISGYLETLSQDPMLDMDLQAPVGEMRRQAERMTTIITELLELSRLEVAQDATDTTPVDVTALMSMLRKDVLARAEHPGEVRLSVESDAMLTGNESEIHSAFSNLVDNAAKYTASTGSITIGWRVDEEGGHFSVTDTGIGIHPDHIPRLTERFYRVDAGRARNSGGSGLGLAIVKHVLQRHDGTLDIVSIQGRGSTFTCHFPSHRLCAATAVREDGRSATA
jgi:two-component system phosphate regulon sensor histidine kinase PhoR